MFGFTTGTLHVMHTVLIHCSEIILKGKNRAYFEWMLKENILKSAKRKNLNIENIEKDGASFICAFSEGKERIIECLMHVFGIKQFLFVKTTPKDLDNILKEMQVSLRKIKESGAKTVNFQTKRSDKKFPLTSPQLNKEFGELANKEGLRVDYSDKEHIIYTNIGNKTTYVSSEKINTYGGLPVGTSGKVLILLSGGIDSPVAAWSLMKRGAHCDFLHVHSFQKTEDVMKSKIPETIKILNDYQFGSKLYTVPYTIFDLSVMGNVPQKYELVLFKHYLLKLAEKIAHKYKYLAIANGDSLSQVASQTLENINSSQYNISLPVFRPLISHNKEEIIKISEDIDTYKLSIAEYKDCCSLVSKHPSTKTKREKFKEILSSVDIEKLINESIDELTIFDIK